MKKITYTKTYYKKYNKQINLSAGEWKKGKHIKETIIGHFFGKTFAVAFLYLQIQINTN